MDKMYRVFISSTYEDLQEERKEVIQALLGIDCVPTGMEIFQATDDNQWNLIQKVIRSCDYYIVIIGGRYGSIHPQTGKSYTQMEYEYALQIGIPILGFIYKDIKNLPWNKIDNISKLERFIELVKMKMVNFWTTPEDLAKNVLLSLHKAFKTHPRSGWINADDLNACVEVHPTKNPTLTPAPAFNTNVYRYSYWCNGLLDLVNVLFGYGITAISNFFDKLIKAHLPKIEITNITHLDLRFPDNYYSVKYAIKNPFYALIILFIEKERWANYINYFMGNSNNSSLVGRKNFQVYKYSGLYEMCSMFSGHFASALSEFLNSRIDITKSNLLVSDLFSDNKSLLVASQEFCSDFCMFKSCFFVEASVLDQILFDYYS